jgi:hypothetical protein
MAPPAPLRRTKCGFSKSTLGGEAPLAHSKSNGYLVPNQSTKSPLLRGMPCPAGEADKAGGSQGGAFTV